MEESLEIRSFEFDQLPSATQFASQIESSNIPAVFKGCIKDWKAFSNWNPTEGGLDYLQERLGTSVVEAMLSRTAPIFYGDIRRHERVALPFSTFIGLCKQHKQKMYDGCDDYVEPELHRQVDSNLESPSLLSGDVAPQQLYLAQAPIMSAENEETVQLETLKEDIATPAFLETKKLAAINLWMNNAKSKSSAHYDPHHNLLCIVAGCKQVVLWPPAASPMLYPMSVYGEASNHSSISLENPDFSIYPRAEHSGEYSQKVILHAGDALFIPEGCQPPGWLIVVLTVAGQNQALAKASSADRERLKRHACEIHTNGELDSMEHDLDQSCQKQDLKGKEPQQRILLQKIGPCSLQALHDLVSLVHDCVNVADINQPMQSSSTFNSELNVKNDNGKIMTTEMFHLEDDPIAKILWTLEPHALQEVFVVMAHNFPRTLEVLILHLLSPVGAEVLTRKFDDMDQKTSEEDRKKFYQVFYGAFDDQFAAMDAILNRKELFALQRKCPN
ncbi:JmjC domain-containing protein [Citrus sinensis]|nr:JmjC domain-containing protein [Citrus sinensis]